MLHWFFTISRVVAIPFCFYYMQSLDKRALYILAYAIFTDFLDGYCARIMGKVSAIGGVADVVADKLLIYAIAVFLYKMRYDKFLLYVIVLWTLRDLALTYFWTKSSISFQSAMIGKIYTFFQFIYIFNFLFCYVLDLKIFDSYLNAMISLFIFLGFLSIRAYKNYFQ